MKGIIKKKFNKKRFFVKKKKDFSLKKIFNIKILLNLIKKQCRYVREKSKYGLCMWLCANKINCT